MEFYVPTLKRSVEAQALKQTLLAAEPAATINIDVDQQLVVIHSEASKETFQQLITATGHQTQ